MKYIQTFTLLATMLTACAINPANTRSAASPQEVKQICTSTVKSCYILDFYNTFSQLTVDAQRKIYDETNQALIESKNNAPLRLKLATMLTLPNSHFKDVNKAQSLLQELAQSKDLNAQELSYANLLYEFTLESVKQQLKLRDESKKSESLEQKNELLQKKSEALEQKNELLQKKHDALEQKLINLKNIEKTLNDRDIRAIEKN
ncbi:MAG TPA: hypothetical protein DCG63_04385 [Methylophilaceae bacterium]|nr:hypothetical protein [Methylophilaceae bacterium]